MVQPVAPFQRQIAPGEKPFQHWPDARGARRQGGDERESVGRTEQCPVALRRGAQAGPKRRARQGEPGRGEEEDRAPETESEKTTDADSAPAISKGQETGQERSVANGSTTAKGSTTTGEGPAAEERSGSAAVPTTSEERQKTAA